MESPQQNPQPLPKPQQEPQQQKKCSIWVSLPPTVDHSEYDAPPFRTCKLCKNPMRLALVHVEIGDYTCFQCEEDVEPRFFCVRCRQRKRKMCDSDDDSSNDSSE